MKVNKRCNNCDGQFDSNKLFYSHIRKCERPKGQFQCPYCPARNSRKDDLIRRHVVDRHPDKVAEVKANTSVIEFIRSERSAKAASPSDSDDEFVRKLDSRLGLYVGGDFEERKELNDIIESRPSKQPRSESPTPALAAPTTPPYEPISSAGEAATAATNLLQVMGVHGTIYLSCLNGVTIMCGPFKVNHINHHIFQCLHLKPFILNSPCYVYTSATATDCFIYVCPSHYSRPYLTFHNLFPNKSTFSGSSSGNTICT